jgi:hypothetical protein
MLFSKISVTFSSDHILVNIAKMENNGVIRREDADKDAGKSGKWIIFKTE